MRALKPPYMICIYSPYDPYIIPIDPTVSASVPWKFMGARSGDTSTPVS